MAAARNHFARDLERAGASMMTPNEKIKAVMKETYAALQEIVKTGNRGDSSWMIAASALRKSAVIAADGRIPESAEVIRWVFEQYPETKERQR